MATEPRRLFRIAAGIYGLVSLAFAAGVAYALYIGKTTMAPAAIVLLIVVLPCAVLCVYLWAYAASARSALRYVGTAMGFHVGLVAFFSFTLAAMLLVPVAIGFLGMHRSLRRADSSST